MCCVFLIRLFYEDSNKAGGGLMAKCFLLISQPHGCHIDRLLKYKQDSASCMWHNLPSACLCERRQYVDYKPLLTSLFHLRYGTMPVNSCHNYLDPYLSKYYPGRTQFDRPTTFFVLLLNLVSWNVRGGILLAECGGAEFIPSLCLQTQDTVSVLQFACKIHQGPLSEIKITVPQAVHWYDSI